MEIKIYEIKCALKMTSTIFFFGSIFIFFLIFLKGLPAEITQKTTSGNIFIYTAKTASFKDHKYLGNIIF